MKKIIALITVVTFLFSSFNYAQDVVKTDKKMDKMDKKSDKKKSCCAKKMDKKV